MKKQQQRNKIIYKILINNFKIFQKEGKEKFRIPQELSEKLCIERRSYIQKNKTRFQDPQFQKRNKLLQRYIT